MGRMQSKQEEIDGKLQCAIDLCVEIEAIEEDQSGYYIDNEEYTDDEDFVSEILADYPDAIKNFKDREEMAKFISQVMSMAI